MDQEKLRTILQIGETIAVEFKRCSNRIENDVYQSVCSFLNRFGGDIYLGVEDDGTVCGVPENAAGDMVKNFIKIISNPNMFIFWQARPTASSTLFEFKRSRAM